jgi:hypothetical protein
MQPAVLVDSFAELITWERNNFAVMNQQGQQPRIMLAFSRQAAALSSID